MKWEWMLFIGGMFAISIGCLVPLRWLPTLPNDKLLHFFAFGSMTLLVERLAENKLELGIWLTFLLIAGALIECLQNMVPGRKFCWRDLAANAAGILVAASSYPIVATQLI